VALSSLLSLTGFVTPLLAQQQNQTNATTTQQQQNQTEAGRGSAGRVEAPITQQEVELPPAANITTQSQEAGGGAGRTEAPVSEGQQQPGALTPNATVPSPEAGGGGAGRTEPLP
jgi:hypothetical protein